MSEHSTAQSDFWATEPKVTFGDFLSGDEKQLIANEAIPFRIVNIAHREFSNGPSWCLSIIVEGYGQNERTLTLSPNPERDMQIERMRGHIRDHGYIDANLALIPMKNGNHFYALAPPIRPIQLVAQIGLETPISTGDKDYAAWQAGHVANPDEPPF